MDGVGAVPGVVGRAPNRARALCTRALLVGAAVALLVGLGSVIEIEAIQAWVAAQGPLAPLVFVLGGAILSLLCVPLDLLCVMAGVLFDFAAGLVFVTAANYLGQCLAYSIARAVLRESLGRFVAARPRLKLVERAIEARGALLLFLLRLAPVPAAPTSYLVGATKMPFGAFAVANLGLVPISFLSLSVSRSLLTAGAAIDGWMIAGAALAGCALVAAAVVVRRALLAAAAAPVT